MTAVPAGALLIRRTASGSFRLAGEGVRLGSAGRTLRWAHPLPWRASILLTRSGAGPGDSESVDLERVRERHAELVEAARPLGFAASALALFLFVGAPIWLATGDPRRIWPPLLVALVVLVLTVAVCHFRAHRRLFPGEVVGRWSATLAMLLLPTDAARAYATLSRNMLTGFDPLTALAALGDRRQADDLLARRLRELEWPTDEERQASTELERRAEAARIAALRPVLPATPAASPLELGVVARCPRCLTPYGRPVETCADCHGVPVLPVDRGAARAARA